MEPMFVKTHYNMKTNPPKHKNMRSNWAHAGRVAREKPPSLLLSGYDSYKYTL